MLINSNPHICPIRCTFHHHVRSLVCPYMPFTLWWKESAHYTPWNTTCFGHGLCYLLLGPSSFPDLIFSLGLHLQKMKWHWKQTTSGSCVIYTTISCILSRSPCNIEFILCPISVNIFPTGSKCQMVYQNHYGIELICAMTSILD